MGEQRGRRVLGVVSGAVLLAASLLVAPPGSAEAGGPTITASMTYADPVNGGLPDYFWVNGMTPYEAVHATVDYEPDGTPDVVRDVNADENGNQGFPLGTHGELQPGSVIAVSGTVPSAWTEQLVVQPVRVEYADPFDDAVGGIAAPGATIQISVWPTGGGPALIAVTETADGSGWWHHDFGAGAVPFDLPAEQTVSAAVDEGDADLSTNAAYARRPVVRATVGAGPNGYVLLNDWPDGTPATVEMDFEPDGTVDETVPVIGHRFGPGLLPENGQLQPGSHVTVTAVNGEALYRWQKVLDIEPLSVDGWNVGSETVGGSAPPNRSLSVEIVTGGPGPSPARVDTTSDENGQWSASFAGSWDLQPGNGLLVLLPEDSADDDVSGLMSSIPASPVTLNAWPTAGLWDGAPVGVYVGDMPPNSLAFLTVNVAADPFNQVVWLPGMPISDGGWGSATVYVPRFVGDVDCATAPGTCILVTADPTQPFERNASLPLSFGRLDLFRFTPNDPQYPPGGGEVGAPITGEDTVAHGEWIWVQGSGFEPGQGLQLDQCKDSEAGELCRNTWGATPGVSTDELGQFGTALEVGRNVFGSWGTQPSISVEPSYDLRDGDTVLASVTGLPIGPGAADCEPGQCWIGARRWGSDLTTYRSDPLTFSGEPLPISVRVAQALSQQMEGIVHIVAVLGGERQVSWDYWTGSLTYPYTAIERWVEPDLTFGLYSPLPKATDDGRYDCADQRDPEPGSGAVEPVHCVLSVGVREGSDPHGATFLTWSDLHFAAFELTAKATAGVTTTKPTGVRLSGEMTCTGFMPERYLVDIEGTVTQTTTGRRPTTVSGTFHVEVECSGTMANPGRRTWSVVVPGGFKAGPASVELYLSSAGFTPENNPQHETSAISITAPPKGKGGR
ncbi:MAG TPA: hypothetical protein VFV32_06035 [Acidimicrobiales bacterium]|nr:hypothetical protein [Acidimicrobiales bacterium]